MQTFVTDVSWPIQTAKPFDRFIAAIDDTDVIAGPQMTTLSISTGFFIFSCFSWHNPYSIKI
jgi:hypothetical protein